MAGLPYLDSDELQVLFAYKTKASMYNAVQKGNFPVPIYRMGRRIVADREVVRQFFERQRQAGIDALKEE